MAWWFVCEDLRWRFCCLSSTWCVLPRSLEKEAGLQDKGARRLRHLCSQKTSKILRTPSWNSPCNRAFAISTFAPFVSRMIVYTLRYTVFHLEHWRHNEPKPLLWVWLKVIPIHKLQQLTSTSRGRCCTCTPYGWGYLSIWGPGTFPTNLLPMIFKGSWSL